MRQVIDPTTGESLEVLSDSLVGTEPYDYATFRRMCMTVSSQHRAAIANSTLTGEALSKAEADYHRQLAIEFGRLKPTHGAGGAEILAKGSDAVLQAKEGRDSAAARDRAAMETVRLCRADRDAAQAMGFWSREADADGWQK